MNLWQIRHIPNSSRNLFKFTVVVGFGLMANWWAGTGIGPVRGQDASKTESAKSAGPDSPKSAAATDFIKQVHSSLYQHSSIKADLEQMVTIGNQQFLASGQYISSGPKLRLEYTIKPDQGMSGGLLEVCDGKDLWSLTKILDSKRVTHRDVQQIKAAVRDTRTVDDAVLTAELGLGGLAGLVASLERTMKFEAMKEVDGTVTIEGGWKSDFYKKWVRNEGDPLPAYVPDQVRIFVDRQTMFPSRIVYTKKVVEKGKKDIYRSMVSLKFTNVEFDTPIGDQEFAFEPGEGVVPEDITRQYLDRIKKSSDSAATPAAK